MAVLNEEQKILSNNLQDEEVIKVYNEIPYSLIRKDLDDLADDFIQDISEICGFYRIYKKGKDFFVEGTNGDYVPAQLKYKMAATLINKEARFLFAEQPDISINPKGDLQVIDDYTKESLTVLNDLVKTILDKNNFQDALLKGAKDCFIGKRVGCLVNFNEEDGVTITFLKSTQFIFETKPGNNNILTKFICYIVTKDVTNLTNKRIFRKSLTLEDDGLVYLEENIFDGTGVLVETVTTKQPTKMKFIPAVVLSNDGLTGEKMGESEVELLQDYELWYSKLGNADSDAQRKSMNPTKYTVDMDNHSTKNLSTGAGAFWDLGSDQNLAESHPMVGLLEPRMNYSEALKTSLDRIKTSGYEQVDMPNITLDTLQGSITTGKALKAIYWPLIVRCKEKMKTWGPAITSIVDIIIQGSLLYPKCVVSYTQDAINDVSYEIDVVQNTPLPEDEIEEKTTNLAEVEASVISKKTYMKRWYGLTDDEVMDELYQIALERQILDDSAYDLNNGYNGDNKLVNAGDTDFAMAGVNAINSDGSDDKGSKTQYNGGIFGNLTKKESGKSLNGAQMNQLVNIMNSYKNGIFTKSQAISLIKSMGLGETFAISLLEDNI